MVRINVTLNVTLTGSSPSTREDVDTDEMRSRPPGEMRTNWCTGVACIVPVQRSRPMWAWSAVMAGSMPGVTASIVGGTDDTCPGDCGRTGGRLDRADDATSRDTPMPRLEAGASLSAPRRT